MFECVALHTRWINSITSFEIFHAAEYDAKWPLQAIDDPDTMNRPSVLLSLSLFLSLCILQHRYRCIRKLNKSPRGQFLLLATRSQNTLWPFFYHCSNEKIVAHAYHFPNVRFLFLYMRLRNVHYLFFFIAMFAFILVLLVLSDLKESIN